MAAAFEEAMCQRFCSKTAELNFVIGLANAPHRDFTVMACMTLSLKGLKRLIRAGSRRDD